jgi:polygalacturonase
VDTYGIDVTAYGTKGDGLTDDAAALQRALDARQSRVVVPAGTYRIGQSLRIGSDTLLILHPRARIVLADGAGVDHGVHLITNKDPVAGNRNIHIEGGIWDGNNPSNPRGPDVPGSYTGVAINFINVRA